ncbi:MAG TPA: hypothetical protein VGG20_27410 [Thermoanaerobaculia bacterium]|jgi:hypothetical protein
MRGFAAVFTREIFERRLLGVVSLALGVVAVVLPLIPGLLTGGLSVGELQGALAFGCALLLTVLLALFLGGSVIASDLVERRLGFYLARPLAGWAVWAGKMAAALMLVLGAGFLVFLPALLAGGSFNLNGVWGLGEYSVTGVSLVLTWAIGLLLLLLATHAVSVVIRARSVWALLDILALALVAGLVWGALRWLHSEGVVFRLTYWSRRLGQLGILAWMEIGFFVALLLALALAGAFQVMQGRTDVRRSHRVLSLSLWGVLLTAAFLFMGVAGWTLSAGPDDLLGVTHIVASPGGRWVAFTGPAEWRPGYDPSFLYDVDTGRSIRARFGVLSLYNTFDSWMRFSADGRRAVWLELENPPYAPVVLYQIDLTRPGARPQRTSITLPAVPSGLALSPDGRRVAIYPWDRRLTVEEIGGRLLAAVPFSGGSLPLLAFVGNDRVRIFDSQFAFDGSRNLMLSRDPATGPDIFELDLIASPPRLVPTGVMPRLPQVQEMSLSPDAGAVLQRSRQTLQLFDARSGAVLAVLGDGGARGSFLKDGRIALVSRVPGGQELRLLSPDGRAGLWRIPFPGARTLTVADQRDASGPLKVVTSGPGPSDPTHQIWQVDLDHGTARSLGRRQLASLENPMIALRLPKRARSLSAKDGLIWLDFSTFRQRVVLKGS